MDMTEILFSVSRDAKLKTIQDIAKTSPIRIFTTQIDPHNQPSLAYTTREN